MFAVFFSRFRKPTKRHDGNKAISNQSVNQIPSLGYRIISNPVIRHPLFFLYEIDGFWRCENAY
jgi:hypothetical protein